ncbi:MAG TPA: hypothetical protein PKK00_05780 [Bacteroidales bacterium]|nr:hypothetical protein [Bacteroidales bacterium]HPS16326.1 hypothetical protein [Bacteroidales bacterium]
MAFKSIKTYVPQVYHKFLPVFFDSEIPEEKFANCQDCPMICESRADFEKDLSKPFAPDTKCCTFFPKLPNYMVGAVLSDTTPEMEEGRKRLLQKIKEKKGVLPHGIYPTKKYSLLYEHGRKLGFGKSINLQCPYYLQGEYNCSLWKYREAICATWFCKSLTAHAGISFWNRMTAIMKHIQESVILHVFDKLELRDTMPFGDNSNISYEDMDDLSMHKNEYSFYWQQWEGKEDAFYKKSFELFNELTLQEFSSVNGPQFNLLVKQVKEHYNNMMVIPNVLIPNPEISFFSEIEGTYRIKTSAYIERNESNVVFAFDIPESIINAFDGIKTNDEIFIYLEKQKNITLGKDVLLALYHNHVLISK